MKITEHSFSSERHTSFYLSCGPEDGQLVIMTHGWPELSLSWRHQLSFLGNLGFHAIAPDMRGYGNSSIYDEHTAYTQEEVMQDMLELFNHFKKDKAIWIGHDWGSVVAWNVAIHHPEIVKGVASLCVPFGWGGHPERYLPYVDRDLYPEDEFPYGQWDYQFFHMENFDVAMKDMETDPYKMLKLMFRKADPASRGQMSPTALISKMGGWFKILGPDGLNSIGNVEPDTDVVTEEEIKVFGDHLVQNGFFGPNSWYVNGHANDKFAKVIDKFEIPFPALLIHAELDAVLDTKTSKMTNLTRAVCTDLTEKSIVSGHWMAQEKPDEVNQIISNWIDGKIIKGS